jgi:glycosyltransferase involved in cell wall biosynthesis
MRVLAIHLTKPSNSEANVAASLLAQLGGDFSVDVLTNRRGRNDPASHFRGRADDARLRIHELELGLPIDPQARRHVVERVASRILHVALRRVAVRVAQRMAPEIVYTSQQRFDCHLGEMIARRLRLPHVVHLHYHPHSYLGGRALARLVSCDHVIAISHFIAESAVAAGVAAQRITVLHNPLRPALRNLPPASPRPPATLGHFGRMTRDKGFEDSVRAFATVRDTFPDARLLLVGDGPLRGELEALVAGLGLERNVDFLGWVQDPLQVYSRCHVCLCPMRSEPFGLVVLEAMALSIPVVAYRQGGLPELVRHGETGLLTDTSTPEELARGALRLLADEPLRLRMGSAARARANSEFSADDAARVLGGVFDRVHAARAR